MTSPSACAPRSWATASSSTTSIAAAARQTAAPVPPLGSLMVRSEPLYAAFYIDFRLLIRLGLAGGAWIGRRRWGQDLIRVIDEEKNRALIQRTLCARARLKAERIDITSCKHRIEMMARREVSLFVRPRARARNCLPSLVDAAAWPMWHDDAPTSHRCALGPSPTPQKIPSKLTAPSVYTLFDEQLGYSVFHTIGR